MAEEVDEKKRETPEESPPPVEVPVLETFTAGAQTDAARMARDDRETFKPVDRHEFSDGMRVFSDGHIRAEGDPPLKVAVSKFFTNAQGDVAYVLNDGKTLVTEGKDGKSVYRYDTKSLTRYDASGKLIETKGGAEVGAAKPAVKDESRKPDAREDPGAKPVARAVSEAKPGSPETRDVKPVSERGSSPSTDVTSALRSLFEHWKAQPGVAPIRDADGNTTFKHPDGRVAKIVDAKGERTSLSYDKGVLSKVTFPDGTIYRASRDNLDALRESARGGDAKALTVMTMMAAGKYNPDAKSGTPEREQSDTAKAAAETLQGLARDGKKKEVLDTALRVYGSDFVGKDATSAKSGLLLNVIANVYTNKTNESPVFGKGSMDRIHSMLDSIAARSDFRGVGHSENLKYVPLLGHIAAGAADDKAAERASDKIKSLWMTADDRQKVHAGLIHIHDTKGDRSGKLVSTICEVATNGRVYDGRGTHAESVRQAVLKTNDEFLSRVATKAAKEIAAMPAGSPERAEKLRDYFKTLDAQVTTETHRRPGSGWRDGGAGSVLPKELADAIPKLSKEAQDMLLGAAPLLKKLASGFDAAKGTGTKDFERLAELSRKIQTEALTKEERAAFQEHIGESAHAILGKGELASAVVAKLPHLSPEAAAKSVDICRTAHAIEKGGVAAAAATPEVVADIAKLAQTVGRPGAADLVLSAVLKEGRDETAKKHAFEYFKLFGWDVQHRATVETSVRDYAADYMKKHPEDHNFAHDASRMGDTGKNLPLPVLLRQLGIDDRDPKIKEALDKAVEKRGEDAVRQALINLASWNAMSPALRGAMFPTTDAKGMPVMSDPFAVALGAKDEANPFSRVGKTEMRARDGKGPGAFPEFYGHTVTFKDVMSELSTRGGDGLTAHALLSRLGDSKGSVDIFGKPVNPEVDILASRSFSARMDQVRKYFEGAEKLARTEAEAYGRWADTDLARLGKTAKEGPGFFDGTKFIKDQDKALESFRDTSYGGRKLAGSLSEIEQAIERLNLAKGVHSYTTALAEGRRSGADKTAIDVVKKHGMLAVQAYAPTVHADLVGLSTAATRTAADTGIAGRMARRGDESGLALAEVSGHIGWKAGLDALRGRIPSGELSEVARARAVDAMKHDQRYSALMKGMAELGGTMQDFHTLFNIGARGSRTDRFADECRRLGISMSSQLDRMSSETNRKNVEDMLKDKDLPREVRASLEAIKKLQDDWTSTDSRGNKTGKLAAMLEHVKSGDFDGSTWSNWTKNNLGYILMETAITAGLTVSTGGLGGAYKATTFGAKALSYACAAARVTASMAAAEVITKETKYALGSSARGHVLGDAARAATLGDRYLVEGGEVKRAPTIGEAFKETGHNMMHGFGMNLALMGFGELVASGLNRVSGVSEAMKALETLQSELAKAPFKTKIVGEFVKEFLSLHGTNAADYGLRKTGEKLGLSEHAAGIAAAFLLATAQSAHGHVALKKSLGGMHLEHSGSSKDFAHHLEKVGFKVTERGGEYFVSRGALELKLKEVPLPAAAGGKPADAVTPGRPAGVMPSIVSGGDPAKGPKGTETAPSVDPAKLADLQARKKELMSPVDKAQAEIGKLDAEFKARRAELEKQFKAIPDGPEGDAAADKHNALMRKEKTDYEAKRKTMLEAAETLRRQITATDEYRKLDIATHYAEGKFAPGEHMVKLPDGSAVRVVVGQQTTMDADGKITRTPSGAPVSEKHVDAILKLLSDHNIRPDQLTIRCEPGSDTHGGLGARGRSTYELTINTGHERFNLTYNHETGHLFDLRHYKAMPEAVRSAVDSAYHEGLTEGLAATAAKHLGADNTPAFRDSLIDGLKKKDTYYDTDIKTARDHQSYLASKSEVFAEMFKLHQEQQRHQRETGETLSYKELVKRFTTPVDAQRGALMQHFEKMFDTLSQKVFPSIPEVGKLPKSTSPAGRGELPSKVSPMNDAERLTKLLAGHKIDGSRLLSPEHAKPLADAIADSLKFTQGQTPEKRLEALQSAVNKVLADRLSLPPIELSLTDGTRAAGAYEKGKIVLDRGVFERGSVADTAEVLAHELTHHDQFNLMIRRINELLPDADRGNPDRVMDYWNRKVMAMSPLAREHVEAVLRTSPGRLSAADVERARVLLEKSTPSDNPGWMAGHAGWAQKHADLIKDLSGKSADELRAYVDKHAGTVRSLMRHESEARRKEIGEMLDSKKTLSDADVQKLRDYLTAAKQSWENRRDGFLRHYEGTLAEVEARRAGAKVKSEIVSRELEASRKAAEETDRAFSDPDDW